MSRRGMNGRSVAALSNPLGGLPIVKTVTLTGAETENIFNAPVPYQIRVLRAWGTMLAAGTSSDTCVLQRVRSGTTSPITDTADLSALSDTDTFEFSQYDNDYWSLNAGDTLQATTANGPAADHVQLTVMFCRTET